MATASTLQKCSEKYHSLLYTPDISEALLSMAAKHYHCRHCYGLLVENDQVRREGATDSFAFLYVGFYRRHVTAMARFLERVSLLVTEEAYPFSFEYP